MISGDPALTGTTAGPLATVADDTEGCLCLVAGYASRNGLLARVTAEAGRQVMLSSPALGDFLQLRYVDLGPRPGPDSDQSRPVHRIAADLMTAQETAGRSHFALIVIAKSATTIEGLLSNCAAEPFLASLRMRCTGIASFDDREEGDLLADVVTSAEGSWRSEQELIDALCRVCEDLPHYFAARGEPGLTRIELAALRQALPEPSTESSDPGGTAEILPDEEPAQDVLDDAPEAGGAVSSLAAPPASAADSAPAGPVTGTLAALSPARWLAGIPLWRAKRAASAGDPEQRPEELPRTAAGLAYLLMIMDRDAAADPALGRLQAALIDVGRRLAVEPSCEYQIRVVHGDDRRIRSKPQTTGRTVRWAMKPSVQTEDFTAVLKVIRSSLRHDREFLQSLASAEGLSLARPAVIIFTVDPPMAELGATTVFSDIAAEARVVWVVPSKLEGLVSPAFSRDCGVTVLGEHQAVADDILDIMREYIPSAEQSDDPATATNTAAAAAAPESAVSRAQGATPTPGPRC